MKKCFTIFAISILLVGLSACSSSTKELKSPCVGAEGSPCDKRPANEWLS